MKAARLPFYLTKARFWTGRAPVRCTKRSNQAAQLSGRAVIISRLATDGHPPRGFGKKEQKCSS
jgi:hypothetical protein